MKKYTTTEVIEILETLRQDTSGVFQSSSELIHNASYNKKLDYQMNRNKEILKNMIIYHYNLKRIKKK